MLISGCGNHDFSHYPATLATTPLQQQATWAPAKPTTRPYVINGKTYVPQQFLELEQVGIASHYGRGDGFHGRPTATGEVFNMHAMTAAHKTAYLPCVAKVTNLENGRSVILKINDRGPFIAGRDLDVSWGAAQALGFAKKGLARVHLQVLVMQTLALHENQRAFAKANIPVPGMPPHTPVMLASASLAAPAPQRIPAARLTSPQSHKSLGEVIATSATKPSSRRVFVHLMHCATLSQARTHYQKLRTVVKEPLQIIPSAKGFDIISGPLANPSQAHYMVTSLKARGLSRAAVRFQASLPSSAKQIN